MFVTQVQKTRKIHHGKSCLVKTVRRKSKRNPLRANNVKGNFMQCDWSRIGQFILSQCIFDIYSQEMRLEHHP